MLGFIVQGGFQAPNAYNQTPAVSTAITSIQADPQAAAGSDSHPENSNIAIAIVFSNHNLAAKIVISLSAEEFHNAASVNQHFRQLVHGNINPKTTGFLPRSSGSPNGFKGAIFRLDIHLNRQQAKAANPNQWKTALIENGVKPLLSSMSGLQQLSSQERTHCEGILRSAVQEFTPGPNVLSRITLALDALQISTAEE
jgi:hypothetical protein